MSRHEDRQQWPWSQGATAVERGEEALPRCVKSPRREGADATPSVGTGRLSTKHWVSFIMVVVWEVGVPH